MPKGFWFHYFVKLNWNIPQVTSTVSSIWQMNQKPVGPFYDNFSEIPREISAIWLPRPRIGVTSKDGRRHFFFLEICDELWSSQRWIGRQYRLKEPRWTRENFSSRKKKVRAKLPPSQPPPPVRLTPKNHTLYWQHSNNNGKSPVGVWKEKLAEKEKKVSWINQVLTDPAKWTVVQIWMRQNDQRFKFQIAVTSRAAE